MIKFLSLTLKNFLSYGAAPTVINLDRAGTTLILGEDLDNTDRGAGANGVGKTVIINALVYALYDKPISNISKDNLVNNINKKNMIVTLEFSKGDTQYMIHRARKTKAGASGNWVKLFVDGEDKTPDSVGNTNKEIENILGLPFDLFVRICAVSANHVPFLDLPVRHPTNANQTDIIEKLFDLKTLTEKADLLKLDIKDAEASLALHSTAVQALIKAHEDHENDITRAEKRVADWVSNRADKMASVQAKLDKLQHIDVDGQRDAVQKYEDLVKAVVEARGKHDAMATADRKVRKELKGVMAELKHLELGECPYCLQEYAAAETKKNELIERQTQLEAEHEELETMVDEAFNVLDDLESQATAAGELVTVSSVEELYDIRGKISGYEKQLADLQKEHNPLQAMLDDILEKELEPVDMTIINEKTNLITHQKFLMKLLTKKDSFVRKALLNKNIPFLNVRLAGYLLELGLPHTVEFSHEMTAKISQFGRPMDFGNLSNGQRARVNIALSFAFRDVLQSIHERVNVCMLDEVLDVGLDTIGVQAAAKMLKNKAREEQISMYIISHRDEIDSAFDRTMNIQMTKGFSYLGEEDE